MAATEVKDDKADVAVEPKELTVDALATAGADEQEAADEAEFQRLVAKREAEKRSEADPKSEPEPEPKATPATPAAEAEPSDKQEPAQAANQVDDDLAKIADPALRDALAKRLKEGEEAAARAKKLDLDNRSLAGRMSAYQRKYEEAAGKRPAEVRQEATAESEAEWTQFASDYPDVAKAIEKRLEAKLGSTPSIAKLVEYVETEQKDRFLTEAWDAVEAVHAGWRELGKTEEFQEWMKSSPTYGRLASSDDVADAIALFDLWKGSHPTPSNPKTPTPAEADQAAKLSARRKEQAAGASSPSDRGATPNTGVDLDDEDQLFAFHAAKANKRLRERYQ